MPLEGCLVVYFMSCAILRNEECLPSWRSRGVALLASGVVLCTGVVIPLNGTLEEPRRPPPAHGSLDGCDNSCPWTFIKQFNHSQRHTIIGDVPYTPCILFIDINWAYRGPERHSVDSVSSYCGEDLRKIRRKKVPAYSTPNETKRD